MNITIKSDNVLEGIENFTAAISTANAGFPSVSAGGDNMSTISIHEVECTYVPFVHARIACVSIQS